MWGRRRDSVAITPHPRVSGTMSGTLPGLATPSHARRPGIRAGRRGGPHPARALPASERSGRDHTRGCQDQAEAHGQDPRAVLPDHRGRRPHQAGRPRDRGDREVPPDERALAHRGGLRAGPALAVRRRAADRPGAQDPGSDRGLAEVQGPARRRGDPQDRRAQGRQEGRVRGRSGRGAGHRRWRQGQGGGRRTAGKGADDQADGDAKASKPAGRAGGRQASGKADTAKADSAKADTAPRPDTAGQGGYGQGGHRQGRYGQGGHRQGRLG